MANPANPTPVPANGTASATITVTLLDASSNPVVGHTVTLDDGAASSTIGAASGPSNASGQVTFPVTNTTVEVATYTAMDTTNAVTVTQTAQVNFTTPPAGVIITGLTPASYVPVAAPPGLQVGDRIYIDRTYTFTTVPALVQGEAYIRTANAHKTNATNPFLTFTVDQPVTVYVAHDKRIVLKPSWFPSLGFVDSGENLVTMDAEFDLFVASFPAGPIQLGGNESPGGASSMYSVIVQSQGSPPPPTDAGTSTVVANPANPTPVPANGTASATITVTLLDASSNPVVGHTVTLDDGAASSTIGAASGPSNASGQVTFPVTNTTVEVATYTAMDTTNAVTVTQTAQVNFTTPPAGVIITGLTPASYVPVAAPPGLQVGDRIYIDRTYTFTTVPALVQGEAYIRTANAHKTNATNPFLTFTVDQPVTVYVAHDKRIVLKPSWFPSLGFVDSGENLVTTDAEFDLFVASFPAGPIQLGGNESPGGASSMYSIIVRPE